MINGLDLFTGIGGLSLALQTWVKPVAYCENERYCQSVLLSRMSEGLLGEAPIWDDVRTLRGSGLPSIDIIYAGFPCQDISIAGHGKGLEGERSGLFYEVIRIASETGAPFLFLENVPAIRTRGLREVVRALTDLRYDCRWTIVSAAEVGAPHIRERWFLLAHSECFSLRELEQWMPRRQQDRIPTEGESVSVDDGKEAWRGVRPNFYRMDDGGKIGMEQIKSLGNAVVQFQAREAFKRLMGL